MDRPRVGIIGMGLLGGAMAERLLEQGWHVLGFDRSPERCATMQEHGVEIAASSLSVARACKRMLLSLPTSSVAGQVLARWSKATSRRKRRSPNT